jgi:hypothetical protein
MATPQLTYEEQQLMLVITGLTNFACFPGLYILYHKGLFFQFHIGLFTFLTSFMYHSLESVNIERFYLDRGTWHKLDNIGSIQCFIMLFIYWMDNLNFKKGNYFSTHTCPKDVHLNMLGLILVLIMQANHPWKLENTVIPIMVFFLALIFKTIFIRRPRYNSYYIKRGSIMLFIAICFFVKGLDEYTDYLRISHGMWHCFVQLSSFYLWQSIDKDAPLEGVVKCESQKRFEFFTVFKTILYLRILKDVSSSNPKFSKISIHTS